jgi:multidrug efflux pump subunit AcrB
VKATEFFIARPRLAAVVALVVVLAGVLSSQLVPVAMYPTLARPSISVSCSYPGANAVEVMNTVAGPLEEKINGVEGMNRMTSSCHDNGSYSLSVNFAVGYDRDVALMKVQSKVQQAMSLLPQEVKNTGVTVESGTTEELGILTLRSAGGRLTPDQVTDYVFGVVNPAVLRVEGVGKSTVKAAKLAVRVWMKPERLAARGLNTEDVVAAIKAQNVQASLGAVGTLPTENPDARVVTLISKGRLSSPGEFGEIIVSTDTNGGLVRLKDIADIGTGPENYSNSALYGDDPAVYIVLYLLPGANPLETMEEVKGELKKLEPFFPADLVWDMTYDTTSYMYRALHGLALSIAIAVIMVFAVLLLALRSLKGALVVTLSLLVPASMTVVVLMAAGFQVNLLSLYAFLASIAFAAGMAAWSFAMVRKGRLPGMEQVAAAAVVACAAIPLALVDGVQGVLFRQFSVVFIVMAIAAAFNSLLLVPVAARRLAAVPPAKDGTDVPGDTAKKGVSAAAFLFAALLGLVAYVIYSRLPQEFVPDEDMGILYVDCKTAEGTPMETTSKVMRRVYAEVSKIPGVKKCTTLLGESIINGSGENQAKMVVVLDDWSKRGRDSSSYAIGQKIKKITDGIPEAEMFVLRTPPVKGMGTQGGVTVLFQSIGDNDPVKFSREVLRMRGELGKSPLVEMVTGGFYTDTPHLRIIIDRAKCELMKVPMSSIYTALQHNLGSIYVNDVNLGTQVNRVTAMADWTGRASPEDVKSIYVRSKTGEMVPVDTLVTCREELGPRSCYRCNQYLYCTEQFIPKPGVSTSEAIEEVLRICEEKLSPGFLNDWSGFTYESLKTRGDEGLLITLSLLLAYLVLVVYMETWRGAFRVLLPSVASVFGAMMALWIAGVSFSVFSRYALVMLVASTAAMSLVAGRSSNPVKHAFLPLLAALTALPLAFASGAGSSGSCSLGVTLFGGYLAYAICCAVKKWKVH